MAPYLLKLLVLILFSFLIIFFYYSPSLSHVENFDGYLAYVVVIGIIYAVYKFFSLQYFKEKVRFSLPGILGLFLVHLLVLSSLFFYYNGLPVGKGFVLFFQIILYSIFPFIITTINIGFGKKLLKCIKLDIKNIESQSGNRFFSFLISLGLGFFVFLLVLTLVGLAGFYNLIFVFAILALFATLSYKELGELWNGFLSYRFELENHDLKTDNFLKNIALKLVSTESLFIVATLILSINFINIIRPMPIGWDDLGVYMNFPRQLAHAGEIFALGGMYAWQVFTGIGFMIGEPNQAFFLNNVGGVLSFIVLILVVSDLLKNKKETFINIPLLIATIYISMPMVIFQQAKDMKLDQGLFFISVVVLYLLYSFFSKETFKKYSKLNLNNLKLIAIIGLLAGFAFTIKFTSLLLISAIIGVLFFVELGLTGFLGYLSIFFALFTKAGLWEKMNVIYPKGDISFINTFSILALFVGLLFLGFGFFKHKKQINHFFASLGVLLLGVLVAVLPWGLKNISEVGSLSLSGFLNGKVDSFNIDYSLIHSNEELDLIKQDKLTQGLSDSGTTTNEDLGRYFGYEDGINNYIKLPWNLTMQVNQGGEFTTIGFLFLALIPTVLLFLVYRKDYFSFGILFILVSEILLFIIPSTRSYITNIFSELLLPVGYIYILALFLIPLFYFIFSLKNTRLNELFKINLIFANFYIFLWTISAFGIVWYGIVMYFSLLLMIAIGIYNISGYKLDDSKKSKIFKFFGSIIIFIIVGIWFFFSVFPHSFNNLKGAGYPYYKQSLYSADELVFLYHEDYLKILLSLNIDNSKKEEFILSKIGDNLKNIVSPYVGDIVSLNTLLRLLEAGEFNRVFGENANNINRNELLNLQKEAKESKIAIYKGLLSPSEEYRNSVGIYRIGTFLKYYISQNYNRLFEDSLVEQFDDYIYDENLDLTVERMKKLGLGYLLVDLNAATIDKDPRHDLTRRYEELLKTFTSTKLDLVESDSLCLKYGLEKYSKSEKTDADLEDYMKISGVNYESYPEQGGVLRRSEKQSYCYSKMIETINNLEVKDDNYIYLQDIKKYLLDNYENLNTEEKVFSYFSSVIPRGSKVLFEIK